MDWTTPLLWLVTTMGGELCGPWGGSGPKRIVFPLVATERHLS